jgi:hypothetical protein
MEQVDRCHGPAMGRNERMEKMQDKGKIEEEKTWMKV